MSINHLTDKSQHHVTLWRTTVGRLLLKLVKIKEKWRGITLFQLHERSYYGKICTGGLWNMPNKEIEMTWVLVTVPSDASSTFRAVTLEHQQHYYGLVCVSHAMNTLETSQELSRRAGTRPSINSHTHSLYLFDFSLPVALTLYSEMSLLKTSLHHLWIYLSMYCTWVRPCCQCVCVWETDVCICMFALRAVVRFLTALLQPGCLAALLRSGSCLCARTLGDKLTSSIIFSCGASEPRRLQAAFVCERVIV